MRRKKHQDESGNPTDNRGKPPHKGGYHGAKKGIKPNVVWFEIGIGKYRVVVHSPWNAGAKRRN